MGIHKPAYHPYQVTLIKKIGDDKFWTHVKVKATCGGHALARAQVKLGYTKGIAEKGCQWFVQGLSDRAIVLQRRLSVGGSLPPAPIVETPQDMQALMKSLHIAA